MTEKACSEEGVCNPLSSELMPFNEREGAWVEALSIGDDMHKLVKDDGRDDEGHVLIGELVEKKTSDLEVVREVWHVGIDEDVGIEPSPHGYEPASPAENISS
ncbi:MAG TPA: hypothetical protein VI669_09925 [Vicinamibacteria bacterium]